MPPRTNPRLAQSLGSPDTQSKAKAQQTKEQAVQRNESAEPEGWPVNPSGKPLVRILMTAAELVPTGQYANCSVGPAQITAFIDPDRDIDPESGYFSEKQLQIMAQALNELAEVIECEVVSTQRNLVLESLQSQISGN